MWSLPRFSPKFNALIVHAPCFKLVAAAHSYVHSRNVQFTSISLIMCKCVDFDSSTVIEMYG